MDKLLWGICLMFEHAHYLKYQNRRGEYLGNLIDIVNWNSVAQRFDAASGA